MRSSPEKYVKIENFSWSKSGFGNVMEVSFTFKSELPFAVKDMEVRCEHAASSGTKIDHNTRVIYERLPAKGTLRMRDFNMGFIHEQAARSSCRVVGVTAM